MNSQQIPIVLFHLFVSHFVLKVYQFHRLMFVLKIKFIYPTPNEIMIKQYEEINNK